MSVPENREPREGARSPIFEGFAVLSGQAAQGGKSIIASPRHEWLVNSGEAQKTTPVGRRRQYEGIQVINSLPVLVSLTVATYDELRQPKPEELAAMPNPKLAERDSHVLVSTQLKVYTNDKYGYVKSSRSLELQGLDDGRIVVRAQVFDEPDSDVEKVQRTLFGGVVDLVYPSVTLAKSERLSESLFVVGTSQDLTDPAMADTFLRGYTLVVKRLEEREKAKERAAKQASAEAESNDTSGAFHITGPDTSRGRGGNVYFAGDGEELQLQEPREGDDWDDNRGGESR